MMSSVETDAKGRGQLAEEMGLLREAVFDMARQVEDLTGRVERALVMLSRDEISSLVDAVDATHASPSGSSVARRRRIHLTRSRVNILSQIGKGRVTAPDIAAQIDTKRARPITGVCQKLAQMHASGLLVRDESERPFRYALTAAGRAAYEAARKK